MQIYIGTGNSHWGGKLLLHKVQSETKSINKAAGWEREMIRGL